MSLSSSSYEKSEVISLYEIIEKGHKLRNAMVQSILDHDPFNTDVLETDIAAKRVFESRLRKRIPSQYSSVPRTELVDLDREKMKAFLRGDMMNKKEEIVTLDLLTSLSGEDLCKTTNQAFNSHNLCDCTTCHKYENENLDCDIKRNSKDYLSQKTQPQDKGTKPDLKKSRNSFVNESMRYVDCVKVIIHEVVLNERGSKKIFPDISKGKTLPFIGSQTFFIEYELPFILSVSTHKSNLKRALGSTKNNNFVRICARRLSNEVISFKQTSIHNIKNVQHINLEAVDMKFQISCRLMRQKNVISLGSAHFNFARFELSPTLCCVEELPINFNEDVPIVLGKLRVTLQMGCDKLYFGKEFIASIKKIPDKEQIDAVQNQSRKSSEISTLNKQIELTPSSSKTNLYRQVETEAKEISDEKKEIKSDLVRNDSGLPKQSLRVYEVNNSNCL